MMITLYGRKTSSNVQAVMWALLELEVSFEQIEVGGAFGGVDTPEYLAMNPNGKVPTITVAGEAIFESSAILRYLGGQFGQGAFWPQDPLARAMVDKWAEWAKREGGDMFTGPIFWRVVRTPAARRDADAIKRAVDAFEDRMCIAEAQLARTPYLAGTELSLADIVLGHVLYRYYDIDITRRAFPHLRAYYDRLTARPNYEKAVMVSYESLRDTA